MLIFLLRILYVASYIFYLNNYEILFLYEYQASFVVNVNTNLYWACFYENILKFSQSCNGVVSHVTALSVIKR